MDNEINYFLYSIGIIKKQNENFLSDIIKAICQYDKYFLNKFFTFCFPHEKGRIVHSMDRETICKPSNDKYQSGRNDFKIYTNNGYYIVESKILDKNISNYKKYCNYLEGIYKKDIKDRITYIVSTKNEVIENIKNEEIQCVYWEDFINELKNDKYKYFITIANPILNYYNIESEIRKKPILDKLIDEKKLCDNFFNEELKSKFYDQKGGQQKEWDKEGGYAYGYTIWASVWFGLLWNPLKGIFWAFAYGTDGDKKIDESIFDFKFIIPIGKYFNDKYIYFEIIPPKNDKKMNKKRLNEAYEEFSKIISVYHNHEYKRLDIFLSENKI